jgi:alpha-1,3-rhamnosyl/mannosyltransferase
VLVALNATALLSSRLTGIGQYTLNLAKGLAALQDAPQLSYFYASHWSPSLKVGTLPAAPTLRSLFLKLVPFPYEVARAIQQHRFSGGVRSIQPDVYHEPNFMPYRFRGPTATTVHDLSWVRYPETHPSERVRIMNKLLPSALSRCDHIIVDSEFVKFEVMTYFGIPETKITTTLLAPRSEFYPRPKAERSSTVQKYGLQDGQFFLCVGTLEPRKNIETAIRAHSTLGRRFPLVIAGAHGWLSSRLERELTGPVQRGEVRVVGFVPDEELAHLYSAATAVVYPSLYEGFGLPPLEAMACGTPAVVSRVTSLPEVVDRVDLQHGPTDEMELRALMTRLADDPPFRADAAAYAIARARGFSWQRCAQQTLGVYKRLVASASNDDRSRD